MTETTGERTSAAWSEGIDAGRGTRAVLAAARVALGLLWMAGASWKTPPDFGRETGSGLFRYASAAVEHPVLPPFSWLMEHLVLPNFVVFGYLVLLLEASLGAFLLVGLATRFWAVLGIAQTAAIALSVLDAPGEWPWSYYLMLVAHVVVLVTAAGRVAGLDGLLRPVWRRSSGRVAALLLRVS